MSTAISSPHRPNRIQDPDCQASAEVTMESSSWVARALTLPVCIVAVFVVMVYLVTPQSIADPDIWWHLRNAEVMAQSHAWPTRDVYSFTVRGVPWIDHEWLAELLFYSAWIWRGAVGLYLVTLLAIEAIFLGVLSFSYRRSRSLIVAFAVSFAACMLGTISFAPRPLLFGWLCLVGELLVFERFRRHRRCVFLLPPLFLLWVNTHGSWIIGIVLLAVFTLGGSAKVNSSGIRNRRWTARQRNTLLFATVLCLGCLFLNPYGWRLVAYPFNLAFSQRLNIANIEEWHSLDFHSARGRILLLSLALLFVAQLLRGRTWTLCDLGYLVVGLYAAFNYSRFLFLAGILVMPMLAQSLVSVWRDNRRQKLRKARPWLCAALLLLLLAPVSRHIHTGRRIAEAGEERFPVSATTFLNHLHPAGNTFNEYLWGGYLTWHVRGQPVFIDSRVDIFEYNGIFADYLDAVRLKNTLAILAKYRIRYVLFGRDTPLVYLLEHTPGWKIDYRDETAVVLERTAAAP